MADNTVSILEGVHSILNSMGLNAVHHEITSLRTLVEEMRLSQSELKSNNEQTQIDLHQTNKTTEDLQIQNNSLRSRVEFSENRLSAVEK